MARGFGCRKEVLKQLRDLYDRTVKDKYNKNYLDALKNFNAIAENYLRPVLSNYYSLERSMNQAWKTCKGSLYEFAVINTLKQIIENNEILRNKLDVILGDDVSYEHTSQIVIKNWCDILPDVDMVLVERDANKVKAILSCKTSLRERLTETAFWKRELEKSGNSDVKVIFITTDKDNELRTETNRYILLHVVDYTFITDPVKYRELVNTYRKKYGHRSDFNKLIEKIKLIDDIENIMLELI